jgi:hypothetical protein
MIWLVAIPARHVTWRDTGAALARITLRKRNYISLAKLSLDRSLLLRGTELNPLKKDEKEPSVQLELWTTKHLPQRPSCDS